MNPRLHNSAITNVPRRRNGRPPACEPCHRRKVACDHRVPVCSRCKNGGITEQCVYVAKRNHSGRALATPPKSSDLQSPIPYFTPASESRPPPPIDEVSGRNEGGFGYLGATSYSAVFQEAQDSLSSMQKTNTQIDSEVCEVMEKCGRLLKQKPSEYALDILRNIPDRETCYELFDSIKSTIDAWVRLAALRLHDSLWETFGDVLEQPRDVKALWGMAEKLCLNTADILREDHTDPAKWFAEFSGQRLRWESLGILYNYWGWGRLSTGHYLKDEKGRASLKLYKDNAFNCSQLCWNACSGNTLMVYLLYQHSMMESIVSGDVEMKHWRLQGDLVALTTYLGLHTSSRPIDDSSISTQVKRRLFGAIFEMDKVTATFAGRPPMISRRFSSTPLQLDISDEDLLGLSNLTGDDPPLVDKNGWNTKGTVYSTTILRARIMMAFIRDAILEMTLHTSSPNGCEETLLDLKRQQMDAHAQFPAALIYSPDDTVNLSYERWILFGRLRIQLEHLQNLFFIERLLAKTSSENMKQLVRISLEMVTLALVSSGNQHHRKGIVCDIEWTIVCYGVPAAGILCMELLKPSMASRGVDAVSKSAIIQQLSQLVGVLEWVADDEPNGELRQSVKDVIKQVLDRVLDPPPQTADPAEAIDGWMMDIPQDMNDLFNFELLDTFDWLRPDGLVYSI